MVKLFKTLRLCIIYILLLLYIPLTWFISMVIAFVGSMAIDYEGIKGVLPFIGGFLIFFLANVMFYFVLRKLYYWSNKE